MFLKIVSDFFGVEDDGSVEIGEGEDEEEVDGWVDEPFPGNPERIERSKVRSGRGGKELDKSLGKGIVGVLRKEELAEKSREREEGGCEDDWDDAGGDEFKRENRADSAISGVAMDAFRVVYRDDTLRLV